MSFVRRYMVDGAASLSVRRRPDRQGAEVLINGVDVAGVATGMSFTSDGAEFPVATVSLLVSEFEADRVMVILDKATWDVLVRLGWTPPPQGGEGSPSLQAGPRAGCRACHQSLNRARRPIRFSGQDDPSHDQQQDSDESDDR